MSVASPSLIPRDPKFPHFLPGTPKPHPIPIAKRPVYRHLNRVRDMQREMDDLSDEENELEDINLSIHNRGYSFLVPIGRSLTQQEEKNDADDESDESGSQRSGGPPSPNEDDGENESGQDLDASMEDLDEENGADSDENEDLIEGDTEEYEEEISEL